MKSNVNMSLGIGCTFAWEKFKADGTITEKGEAFHNLVLNNGLLKLFSYSLITMMTYVNLGTDATAPEPTQTGLLARMYSTNTLFNSTESYDASTLDNWYGRYKIFQFNIGTCTGTFAEIGLSRLSNSDYLNRQLFKDGNGNPVTVTVAADEGLRIIVVGRYYLDSALSQYSEAYSLDLKGATAGSVVFSNGVTTKSITLANLRTALDGRSDLCTLCGADSVTRLEFPTASLTRFFAHPTNQASLNLSIVSHTLTGGSGPPELTVLSAFNPKFKNLSFVLDDQTLGQPVTINYKLWSIPKFADYPLPFPGLRYTTTYTLEQYSNWGFNGGGKGLPYYTLTAIAQALRVYLNGAATPTDFTSVTTTKAPVDGDFTIDVKVYYAPGKLGTGDQVVCGLAHSAATRMNVGFQAIFDPMITVADTEDIEFTATLAIFAKT